MQRSVAPEFLDSLPVHDPDARRSRRDLACVNALMGHAAIMARTLLRNTRDRPPRIVLDLGAGDGTFTLRLARRLAPLWPDCHLILLDRQPVVRDETRAAFAALRWSAEAVAADVFDFLASSACPEADVAAANLFLHHFPDDALSRLLALIAQRAPLFVACEPRRAVTARLGSRLLWALGCNRVTLHDAAASVRAGFRGRELAALWPKPHLWTLREQPAGLFSHCFSAQAQVGAGP